MYKILFAARWESSLWRVTNYLSCRTQKCSDGKLQASKGMLLVGSKWQWQPAAVTPSSVSPGIEGQLSQGLCVGEEGDQSQLVWAEPCRPAPEWEAQQGSVLPSAEQPCPPCGTMTCIWTPQKLQHLSSSKSSKGWNTRNISLVRTVYYLYEVNVKLMFL